MWFADTIVEECMRHILCDAFSSPSSGSSCTARYTTHEAVYSWHRGERSSAKDNPRVEAAPDEGHHVLFEGGPVHDVGDNPDGHWDEV